MSRYLAWAAGGAIVRSPLAAAARDQAVDVLAMLRGHEAGDVMVGSARMVPGEPNSPKPP